jgi:hypothetical protein
MSEALDFTQPLSDNDSQKWKEAARITREKILAQVQIPSLD